MLKLVWDAQLSNRISKIFCTRFKQESISLFTCLSIQYHPVWMLSTYVYFYICYQREKSLITNRRGGGGVRWNLAAAHKGRGGGGGCSKLGKNASRDLTWYEAFHAKSTKRWPSPSQVCFEIFYNILHTEKAPFKRPDLKIWKNSQNYYIRWQNFWTIGQSGRIIFTILLPHWGSYVFVKKIFFAILVSEYSE